MYRIKIEAGLTPQSRLSVATMFVRRQSSCCLECHNLGAVIAWTVRQSPLSRNTARLVRRQLQSRSKVHDGRAPENFMPHH